jgi:(1->4)-alpha-D-glucan 1-alpha-D-glucosylmutase
MSTRLEQLAALHGIGLEYYDIWGHLHRASAATLVALLRAMGVDAATDGAVEASIAAFETARWRTVLAPAVVVHADERAHRIRLHLPDRLDGASLAWRVEEENGTRHDGRFAADQLAVLERVAGHAARELVLELELAPGYHRLALLHDDAAVAQAVLAAVPRTCYRPPALEGEGRVWGVAVQLYGVRSERNWGVGDYTDLRTIVEQWGSQGAGIVGVSPLHALYPHNPAHASPYGPSSRLFRNVLYLDVEAIDDYAECEEVRDQVRSPAFQARLARLRETALVDYPGVGAAKFAVLEQLYAHFRARHLDANTARAQAFRAFQRSGGEPLRRHALYEALQAYFHRASGSVWGWPAWPEPYRDPASPACALFARAYADRVEFFEYLQWQAELQLAAAGRRSLEVGLGVGIYEDLAVSVDRGGAEAWANQGLYAVRASVGAPPDDFSLKGQDWGLPPMVPARLEAAAYQPFIATLRANMRHAGALRIDHVMGLARLFWVPEGGTPADGAYVRYPFADLLGLLALESHRHRCLVVGEDLGTVPDEVRAALGGAGALSYRLLYFERQPSGEFKSPAEYPRQALVAATTHDLPTLAGWWTGRDLAVRAALGLFPSAQVHDAQRAAREQDRARLLRALEREGLLPPGVTANPESVAAVTPELARAVAEFLARSDGQVMVVQLEDVLGVVEQANVPGSIEGHPNWQRRLPLALERLSDDARLRALTPTLSRLRAAAHAPGTPPPAP